MQVPKDPRCLQPDWLPVTTALETLLGRNWLLFLVAEQKRLLAQEDVDEDEEDDGYEDEYEL